MQAPKLQEPAGVVAITPAALPKTQDVRRAILSFVGLGILLFVLFSAALADWFRFAISKERNTYLFLVPIVTAYLIRTCRDLRVQFTRSSLTAMIPFAIGIIGIACGGLIANPIDRLSLQIFALLNFLLAGAFIFFGKPFLRQITFPIAFLIFAVPVPPFFVGHIEVFLQYTSAEAAYWLMSLVGIPMIREGIDFRLPNIYIQVAQECSGYNSTFTLFMVSCVAGYMFLKRPASRAILSLAVIPLAILRNGFRVTTLAYLCVYVDPALIESPIHHKGGPIFFALSLIPFFIMLWALRRFERPKKRIEQT